MGKKIKDVKVVIDGETINYDDIVDFIGEPDYTLDSLDVADILEFIKDKLQELTNDDARIEIRSFSE